MIRSLGLSVLQVAVLSLICIALVSPPHLVAVDEEICPNASSTDSEGVAVVGVVATPTDLSLDLALRAGVTYPLSIALFSGSTEIQRVALAAPPTESLEALHPPGRRGAVFTGAMVDALDRPVSYWIEVEDATGSPVMRPYPFSILLNCPTGSVCDFAPLVGVATTGLLVTERLDQKLVAMRSECAFGRALDRVEVLYPKLRPDVQTARHQLKFVRADRGKGGPGCGYAWKTVVPVDQSIWMEHQDEASAAGELYYQCEGIYAEATQCLSMQGIQASDGLLTAESCGVEGVSGVELEVVCIRGDESCADDCGGTVALSMTYDSCVIAGGDVPDAGVVHASASQSASFRVNDLLSWSQENVAAVGLNTFEADEMTTVASEEGAYYGPEPVSAWLTVDSDLSYAASEGPAGNIERSPFAYADVNDKFWMRAVGTSSCTDQPMVDVTVSTPALEILAEGALRGDGGIKIRRWRDGPGGGS